MATQDEQELLKAAAEGNTPKVTALIGLNVNVKCLGPDNARWERREADDNEEEEEERWEREGERERERERDRDRERERRDGEKRWREEEQTTNNNRTCTHTHTTHTHLEKPTHIYPHNIRSENKPTMINEI